MSRRTFVFGDMHGRHDSLARLLEHAGIIDDAGTRISDETVISIGDLINVTSMDQKMDEEIVRLSDEWVDLWIIGNHEAPLLWPHISFRGFWPTQVLRTEVNRRVMSGRIVPCDIVGHTLLTHAGIAEDFEFESADEADAAIFDVWANYNRYAYAKMGGYTTYEGYFDFGIPKGMLLDGVSDSRGGRAPVGGILWADWDEPKNRRFNQVMGHTPIKNGPELKEFPEDGTWHLNIDSAVKKGLLPSGVWLDENGDILEIVTPSVGDEFFSGEGEVEIMPGIREGDDNED